MMSVKDDKPVSVIGATGYVGSRLIPQLLERGRRVRAVGRNTGKLSRRVWADHPNVELVRADTTDFKSLADAVKGCSAAYYLVHSMISAGRDYQDFDRVSARNMVAAAETAGLEQLIYLGGLGEESEGLSSHLRSRTEVGRILSSGKTPATILRAAMILGSGSASFEILRYLAERLPVMITPRWVHVRVQPIAIRNVLDYLIGCLERSETAGLQLDIGGPDVLTYAELFQIYAREAGLSPRIIIPVPFFTPKLSSYWIHLVSPVPAAIARPLAEGLRNEVVVRDSRIQSIIPTELISCRQAIRLALERRRRDELEACWLNYPGQPPEWPLCEDPEYTGGATYSLAHRVVIDGAPDEAWRLIERIGGRNGYYSHQYLWRIRGMMDRLAGGVGLRRGRRDPEHLHPGDVFDFWRVAEINAPFKLKLMAEARSPGRAFLEFRLNPLPNGNTEIIQESVYYPKGVAGILYWHVSSPVRRWMMKGLLHSIALRTKQEILEGPAGVRT